MKVCILASQHPGWTFVRHSYHLGSSVASWRYDPSSPSGDIGGKGGPTHDDTVDGEEIRRSPVEVGS